MRPFIFIISCFWAISSFSQSQGSVNATFNLAQIALLELFPDNSTVTLNLSSAVEAGQKAAVMTTNNEKWIHFSSAVFPNTSRSISVKIDDGQVPSGIYLKLSTSNYMGAGKGALGSPARILTLSNTPQTIVSNIKGAYTGIGDNNGYKLMYSLEIYDYKLLDFNQSATLSITLTLTDSI